MIKRMILYVLQVFHTRPEELRDLKGDCSKIVEELGWSHEYTFETMIDEMVEHWLNHYSNINVSEKI
jgi:GDP-D-mannose dehydratase